MNNIIYGKNAILNILKHKYEIIEKIYFLKKNKISKDIEKYLKDDEIKIKYIDIIKNAKLKYIKKIHIALLKIKHITSKSIKTITNKSDTSILILDRIQDPHNLASCIRTAEAFNITYIIISDKNSAKLSPLICKASNAASLLIPIIKTNNLKNIIKILKNNNIKIIGLSAKAEKNIENNNLKKPLAIIMGSEKNGIKNTILKECDYIYKIQMLGKLHNINISVATGITLSKIIS